MATSNRRRGYRSGGRPTRKRVWARRLVTEAVLAAGATQHSLVLADFETAYGAQLIGCTVGRIRGTVQVAGTSGGLIYGFRVATASSASEISSLLGPGTEPHADWMTWDIVPVVDPFQRFDVRSMRKFEELGQTLVFSVENGGADQITWSATLSVLVMLP